MDITQAARMRALTLLFIEREQMLESLQRADAQRRADKKSPSTKRSKPPQSESSPIRIPGSCDRVRRTAS